MSEKEERILKQDAQEVNLNAETIREMKIFNAMRNGVAQGKKRSKRRFYSYGAGAVLAAAAAVFLIFFPIGLPAGGTDDSGLGGSVQAASTKSWDDFAAYRNQPLHNRLVADILERDLIKPVRQSATNKGYRMDVDGAVTDGRKVYILFSVHNDTDKEITPADTKIQFGDFEVPYPHRGAALEMAYDSESRIPPGQSKDYIYSTNYPGSIAYSKDVKFTLILTETSGQALASSSNKYRTGLEVSFELDPARFKDQEHTLPVDRTLTVDGQKIKVLQVEYTPLNTYVDLEYDKANTKRIFSLLNPVLIATTGSQTDKLVYPGRITADNSEVYKDQSQATLVFKHTGLNQPDSSSLKIAGISALEPDRMKFVVDLKQQQVIEAPTDDWEIVTSKQEHNATEAEILLRRKVTNLFYYTDSQGAVQAEYIGASLADKFTDAKGQVHERTNRETALHNFGGTTTSSDGTGMDEMSLFFDSQAADYPQPLTLSVERIWNPILETQSIELFSKK
ncbi:hypothetical protein AMQ84_17660 [Paenibacillus riograndensis]|uniref:Uncharacterized protein n=1 Tax=Paenibacillus riograndensis TaxID=483937 RepID=A0A132TVT8_9BACL|nr:DUF4179 domain-containing protein [Paenibacillus riograndensis]KWX75451.1 hypothetical protein AMQ84_17660 [Paenibacillus riograndensis]